ncbi:hypothetical protein [Chromobacterium phragmitis]|uniref:Uncharacterized protein n=1 Tax=Chromobacterium phragmitis TaxID=2202141 RepID=A0A344UCT8_9NEIS|nr:hypothetical protein [Chromobacterium phragmitis]AXE33086.1 hypothetical protein DK843_01430 [Chromobacterium phragmitis]
MTCLAGWSYGTAINNSLLPIIKTALARKWSASGHSNTWNGNYEGIPVSITFKPSQSAASIDSSQENALFVTVPFSGNAQSTNGSTVTFSGTFGLVVDLDTVSVQLSPSSATPDTWDEYLYLTDSTLTLAAPDISVSDNYIYPFSCIPSTATDTVYNALVASLQTAIAGFGNDSPIFLGTHTQSSDSNGKLSPATKAALMPIYTQFITLNYNSSTDAQLAALSTISGATPPTGDWQDTLISYGTFTQADGVNTIMAIADEALWSVVAQEGPTAISDKVTLSYNVSSGSPSVLTVTASPNPNGPSPWNIMSQFGWLFKTQTTLPGPDLDLILTISGAYTGTYEYDMAVALTENSDGTQTISTTWSSNGEIVTFNPGAPGPLTVEALISATVAAAFASVNPYLLLAALIEAILAATWYAILYEAMEKIGSRTPKDWQSKEISNKTFTFENITIGATLESIQINQGLIVGAALTYKTI